MLEEDLFFPGKTFDDDRNSDLDSDSELITRRSSHQDPPVPETNESEGDQSSTLVASSGPSEESGEGPRMTPTPSRSHSPTAGVSPTEEEVSDEARELLAQVYGDYSATLPSKAEGYIAPSAPQPPKRPLLHITTPVNHPPHPSPQSQTSGSAFSLLISSVTGVTPVDSPVHSVVETKLNVRPRGYSLTASPLSKSENGHVSQTNLPAPQLNENVPDTPPSPAVKSPHFLLRTIPKPPINPRDHSLLETIYTQMLGARFINISPLALLANSLGLYFKGCSLRIKTVEICRLIHLPLQMFGHIRPSNMPFLQFQPNQLAIVRPDGHLFPKQIMPQIRMTHEMRFSPAHFHVQRPKIEVLAVFRLKVLIVRK